MEQRRIIHVEERLPILPTIPLSLQHLFAMFGSTVLVPFLLHVDPATALFMNGVGTLIYLTICKWRLPAYLGSSFAFISPVLAVCATPGMSYGDAQGGFIVFGLSFATVLTLVVTPSMLMVFTRDKRRPGERGWFGRLKDRIFRRKAADSAGAGAEEGVPEPAIAYPKAAE